MVDLDHKQCPQCAERIKATAKKCPFCMTPQGKKRWFLSLLALLPFIFMMIYISRIPSGLNKPKFQFADYTQQVRVTSSEMHFETLGKETERTVTVLGTVRNDSNIAWRHPRYEVRFFNKAGKLIDTETSEISHTALAPHQEQGFRIQTTASKPIADYATLQVKLVTAEDADIYHR